MIFRVRDGRVVGREHRFLENVELETDQDVLSTFLVRWYLPAEGKAKRVVLPFAPSELSALGTFKLIEWPDGIGKPAAALHSTRSTRAPVLDFSTRRPLELYSGTRVPYT